jgi:hypothetical protein
MKEVAVNMQSTLTRAFIAAALIAVLLMAWRNLETAPSAPPATQFSARHAFGVLTSLLKEQVPHPTGSQQNQVVRDRLLAELKSYGYEPTVQSALQCSPPARVPGCTQVENIIAVRKGTGNGDAILATAHYDSVPAGPGVGDDGVGVAVMLELARHLHDQPPARNDVIFLLTDGEETGLRGAVAFAEQNPLMKSVRTIINVEARGDTGPSVMFETGQGNAQLISLFASVVPNPVSNSLAYELYRLLPNDTDFTVYKRHGLSGFNFAMIGSASRYHSPRDDLAHLDQRTLQHHGDHVFALAARLLDTDLNTLNANGDASYFDAMGQTMVVWPAGANLPVAIIGLLGILGLIAVSRSSFGWMSTTLAIVSVLLTLGALFALGWLLSFPLAIWPGVHPLDNPEPWPARIALMAALLLIAAGMASLFSSRVPETVASLVAWAFIAILGVALAATLPGAAYALIWPVLVFAVAGWGLRLAGMSHAVHLASLVGFVVIAFFWVAHFVAFDAVIGFNASGLKLVAAFPLALALVNLFQPSKGRLTTLAASGLVMLAAAGAAAQTPGFSSDHPRPMNFLYYDDQDTGKPRWLIVETPADEAFLKAAGFSASDETFRILGMFEAHGRFKPASAAPLPPPSLVVDAVTERNGMSVASATIQAARAGFVMGLAVPAGSGIHSIRVEGQMAADRDRLAGPDGTSVRLFGVGNKPVKLEIEFAGAKSADVVVFERSSLPDMPESRALLASRPHDANQVHSGDGSLVFRKIDLKALTPTSASGPRGP